MDYIETCECLFDCWRREAIDEWFRGGSVPGIVTQLFDLEFLPEPYLKFGEAGSRIAFLTFNPGAGNDFQYRDSVLAGDVIDPLETYAEAAETMAVGYETGRLPINQAATSRINQMKRLAERLGQDGFYQFELFPFHSANFGGGEETIGTVEAALDQYRAALVRHLERFDVVWAISGASPGVLSNPKIRAFARALGMEISPQHCDSLRENAAGVLTVFVHRQGNMERGRFISGNSATNALPGHESLGRWLSDLTI